MSHLRTSQNTIFETISETEMIFSYTVEIKRITIIK